MRIWLKELRIAKSMTQDDVAKELEMSLQSYNYIENGKRQADLNMSLMLKIAELFNITLDQLVEMEQTPTQ